MNTVIKRRLQFYPQIDRRENSELHYIIKRTILQQKTHRYAICRSNTFFKTFNILETQHKDVTEKRFKK